MKNKTKTYTPHPDDLVYASKLFINELSNVQESYFNELSDTLSLNEKGNEWLFDYVFNEPLNQTFTEYLEQRNLSLEKLKELV